MLHSIRPGEILMMLNKDTLKNICCDWGLPVSGSKELLAKKILNIASVPQRNANPKSTMQKCMMCEHLYNIRMLQSHHFVPKSRTNYAGGTVVLCANCHSLFHKIQMEVEKKKGYELTEVDEIHDLFRRIKKDVRAGKYGRK